MGYSRRDTSWRGISLTGYLGTGILHGRIDLMPPIEVPQPKPITSGELIRRLQELDSSDKLPIWIAMNDEYASPMGAISKDKRWTGKVYGDTETRPRRITISDC